MSRILFLCTGIGGRSLMAVAFAEKLASKEIECVCAGDIRQEVHPLASSAMEEIGLRLASRIKRTIEDVQFEPFDVVITLCNHANEICPTFPGSPARLHWALSDPTAWKSHAAGADIEPFRSIRDEIRKRVESLFAYGFLDAVQQVRLTLGSLLDNLTDGVLAHDLDRRIFFFNQAAQRITGYDYAEVVGHDCHQVFPDRICGGDCPYCDNGQCLDRSRLTYARMFSRRDGEQRNLEMSVVTIHSPLGESIGALVLFRDVTETAHLRKRLEQSRSFCGIVGRHPAMQKLFDSIGELAGINVPILIQGETGTGKEMVAAALHQLSKRSVRPFVPVNCGALPEGTLESELFGHVKGAFTGAIHDHKGRFALAEGGTIFLDEISEISPAMQVKLLRVIQEKNFVPVGDEKTVKCDVRIVCATNRDLKLLTKNGLFRQDLFYRLAVVPILLPPLRERRSDIPLLVEHLFDRYSAETGKSVKSISSEALGLLMSYSWPGNVRELANTIQYAMINCRSGVLEVQHLPPEIKEMRVPQKSTQPGRPPKLDGQSVAQALQESGGNRARAAKLLKVSRTTLYRFLDAHMYTNT